MSKNSEAPSDAVELCQRLSQLLYEDQSMTEVPDDVHGVMVNLLIACEAQRNCIESLRDTISEVRNEVASMASMLCDCGQHAG